MARRIDPSSPRHAYQRIDADAVHDTIVQLEQRIAETKAAYKET